jgi:PadR family transcriptional regulator PadR
MQFSKEIMKGAAEIIVLQALKDRGELYGYELLKTISDVSQGVFEFQEGTLYPLLYRLEFKGYVSSEKKNAPSGKERRYYTITQAGDGVLKEKRKELDAFVIGLQHVLHLV